MAFSIAWKQGGGVVSVDPARVLAGFREDLYWSLISRRDALFELCDAVAGAGAGH